MFRHYPIRNEKSSVTRPIALKVANDLKRYLQIIPENTPIIFIDEEGVRQEKGSALSENNQEGIYTQSTELVTLTVSEEYMDTTLLQYQLYDQEFKPIFADEITGTSLCPYYSHTEMRIALSYRAPSKAAAKMWLNSVKSKIRRYQDAFPHHLEYHYEIDEDIIRTLGEVYRLYKNHNPDIMNFSDWLQKHFTRRFGTASDTAGNNQIFVVSEVQHQVFGYFDFNTMIEEGDKVDNATSWVVSFNYLLRYMKPTDLHLWFPRIVSNQLMPGSIVGLDTTGNIDSLEVPESVFPENQLYYTQSGEFANKHSAIYENNQWKLYDGISVPMWAEFLPEQAYSITGLVRFVDQLILFSPDDELGCELVDLRNPQGYNMWQDLVEFIISEGNYLLEATKSVFQIVLYQNNRMLRRDFIKIDKDGKIRLNGEIDINKTYHLRIGLYHDWEYVDPEAIKRLMNWTKFNSCLFTFKDRYGYNECQLGISKNGKCNGKYSDLYFKLIDFISCDRLPRVPKNNNNWGIEGDLINIQKTVQTFWTTAERKNNA